MQINLNFKKLIKMCFRKFGYIFLKEIESFTMEGALSRCGRRGMSFNTVIDVGASDGRWTRSCMKIFPNSNYLLIEAQSEHEYKLLKLKKNRNNIDYVVKVAGNKIGKIFFDKNRLFGGMASEQPLNSDFVILDSTLIDYEIGIRELKGPFLLKLDTHGFEVPILEGAREVLRNTELIVIEVYNFNIAKGSLLFYEMCKYLEEFGFRPIEVVDLMLRKFDLAFWQMDLFFVKDSSSPFEYCGYE